MRIDLLQLAADLAKRGEPFVLAVVVRRQPASSAQPGDMAVITADGAYHGWLGGSCTQPTVEREARRALVDGKPRLVSLSPDPAREARPGVDALPMTCHSGGTVEIYLEPVMPPPRLRVFGASPAARALAQLGKAMGYAIDVVAPGADAALLTAADRVFVDLAAPEARAPRSEPLYVVVATMGENDEESIAAALEARPAYLGVVASRKRFAQLRDSLLARGIPAAALDAIRSPAGIDIGARRPEELAVSVLAEIVKLRQVAETPTVEAEAIDPVCGMTVAVATARHSAEHDGQTYYFCNPRCREKFLAAPERYLAAPAAQGAR